MHNCYLRLLYVSAQINGGKNIGEFTNQLPFTMPILSYQLSIFTLKFAKYFPGWVIVLYGYYTYSIIIL